MNTHGTFPSRFNGSEPVRTLFVRGLPNDVKPREIHNLFRPYPGFQSSSITYSGDRKTPVSFVVFKNQASAMQAMEQLQGIRFDPESHVRLRVEFAKTNSKSKRSSPSQQIPLSLDNPPHSPNSPFDSFSLDPQPHTSDVTNNDIAGSRDGSRSPDMSDENVRSMFRYFFTDSPEASPAVPHRQHPQHIMESKPNSSESLRNGNEPCSTVFLGNIHSSHRPRVEAALQSANGFVRLKISQRDDSLLCWADFHNVQYSTAALHLLHPLAFKPAPGKQVRIEYARNPMGEVLGRHS